MTGRTLTTRTLNRALLARQLLLERASMPLVEAVEQVGGLQTQYAPSGYVGLWTRLRAFERDALTAALEARDVVQATLMRSTIHLVSRREFWRYALGVRRARRTWALRVQGPEGNADAQVDHAQRLAGALADGPRWVKELGELAAGFVGNVGLWVELVRVPPSGTWRRRRADRLALASQWVGPEDASEEDGLVHLVRSYLRAFGPAAWRDISSWAGVPVADLRRGGASIALERYRDEAGRALLDLPGALLPDEDTPAPPRFLPHWDANLLVHARRSGILPEEHRALIFSSRNPFSVGAFLVDGRVAGSWSYRDGRILTQAYQPLSPRDRDGVEAERAALEAFHA